MLIFLVLRYGGSNFHNFSKIGRDLKDLPAKSLDKVADFEQDPLINQRSAEACNTSASLSKDKWEHWSWDNKVLDKCLTMHYSRVQWGECDRESGLK